jgi:Flp pilus assembly protein TadG
MLNRLRQLLRWDRGQEGATAVEFAICLPVLLLLLAGSLEFGWLFYWQHTVTNASRAGARYGVQAHYTAGTSIPRTDAEIKQIVRDNYGADLGVTVTPGSTSGTPLSVTVEKTMHWFFLGFLSNWGVNLPTKINNKTTMTME